MVRCEMNNENRKGKKKWGPTEFIFSEKYWRVLKSSIFEGGNICLCEFLFFAQTKQ